VIKLTFLNLFFKKRGFFKDMSYRIDRYIKLIFTNNEKKINIYTYMNLLIKYTKNVTILYFYRYST